MPVMYTVLESGELEFDADGVKLRNLSHDPRAALVVDAGGPRRGIAVQGRAAIVGQERARLAPERKFSWGSERLQQIRHLDGRGGGLLPLVSAGRGLLLVVS